MTSQFNRWPPAFLATSLLLLGIFGIALGSSVGNTGFESWFAAFQDEIAWQIIWDIRLPRSVGAFVAGALLGLAGAIAQGLFRNPLADPYLLGSASGASLGVAIALALFGGNPFATEFLIRLGLTGAAFIGAVLAVMLTIALAQGVQHTLRLLLAGVIVGVVLGAMASLISLLRPDVLQGMQGFLPYIFIKKISLLQASSQVKLSIIISTK
jgi:iron complex transport system permease protein